MYVSLQNLKIKKKLNFEKLIIKLLIKIFFNIDIFFFFKFFFFLNQTNNL